MTHKPGNDLSELLRSLGKDAILKEGESLGLSPRGNRMRCPFPGCRDKGKERERDAAVFDGNHPRLWCYSCGGRGDLIDLMQLIGLTRIDAIAQLTIRHGNQPKRPLALVEKPKAEREQKDKLSPAEVERLWNGMAKADKPGQEYLEKRGLGPSSAHDLVRFATEANQNDGVKYSSGRGYRVAAPLKDVVGNFRGIQLRNIREVTKKEPKIISVKGSATGKAFFGDPGGIEASPIVAVAEGLADSLALYGFVDEGVTVVGAPGMSVLPRLAEELEAAGINVEGKLFCLFPQNDRPANKSRREFKRLAQLLTENGARVAWHSLDEEFKDLAEWRLAQPEHEWPPPEISKALRGDEAVTEFAISPGSAVAIPKQVRTDRYSQNFTTLCALLDDPAHREAVIGRGDLTLCEMTHSIRIGGKEILDTDVSAIRLGLESQALDTTDNKPLKFNEDDIVRATKMLAARNQVHPVRDYLLGLKWDGEPREVEFASALGHGEESMACKLLWAWLLSLVARPIRPGCKVDTVLVLFGAQGALKSTFLRTIAGRDEWFTDSPVGVLDRDSKMLMRRVWIVEWAELSSMRRAKDQDAIKAFISSQIDFFRPPYGRTVIEAPRHCVIAGTTNDPDFLHDVTGNRRFWPVELKKLNLPWLSDNREQVLAEAVQRLQDGEKWWLSEEDDKSLAETHAEYLSHDPWSDPVEDWIERHPIIDQVTSAEILHDAIGKEVDDWTQTDANRVNSILRGLGWRQSSRTLYAGKKRRAYSRS